MSRKLSNAPVYFTIVQARFNPIMALDSYAAEIQERFRKLGYPDFEKNFLATFNLNMGAPDGNQSQVPVAHTGRYVFQNMEKTAGFFLDPGSLSYQTTEYDVFETFSQEFFNGLKIVHDTVQLSYTDRIGFRYLDAIFPRAGESIEDYLNPWMMGLSGRIDGEIVHSFVETVLKTASAQITARSIMQNGAIGFPPDLAPGSLVVPERFTSLRGPHAILDMDGSHERREAFDIANVKSRLLEIHGEIAKSFRATVTDSAMRVWA
ncbi:TIGR04255 family protein [Microvirga sp. CF3062]|uniref:TIGR04255 family protein n=1 Tax=Microvirga sp. CF3062 TaxID=3110182 RepID=UPI002E7AA574|nr:TIGR04255 family protein [Microvirga sp. CF3062]MEE1658343.1 TIGR04255 family protein [Microvirga sp. CF3062]